MKRYVAFLRGVNVGGKNKIPMSELKAGVESLGLKEVKTYLNSGNVIFSSDEDREFSCQLRTMIKDRFTLDIPVFIISTEELDDVLDNAPDWWGNENKEIYDNLIFIMPPTTVAEVFNEIGGPKEEFEKVYDHKNTVFWSFIRKDYQKTNWWSKTASASVSSKLTIRTANTVRKIVKV